MGDKVKIKTSDGVKRRGVVTQVEARTKAFGPPSQQFPGPISVTVTIELEGPC